MPKWTGISEAISHGNDTNKVLKVRVK